MSEHENQGDNENHGNHANLPEVQDAADLPILPNGLPIPQYTIVAETSLDGNKIVNLADPEYGMDAVNLRTLRSTINGLELGLTSEQFQALIAETPISDLILDAGGKMIHNAGEAALGTDLPNWAQVQSLVASNTAASSIGRSVPLRTVYEGTLAQLQALGNTIAGATVFSGNGETDLESCGVLLLSYDANGIALLPESGIYYLSQSGQYSRAVHFRDGEQFEPGLTFWIDAIDARYEVLDRGTNVANGFGLKIRLSPRPSEVAGEGVLHSRPTGSNSSAIRLDFSDQFTANNGILDLAPAVKTAIDTVPGLVTDTARLRTDLNAVTSTVTAVVADVANTASQVAVQQEQIDSVTNFAHSLENAIDEVNAGLAETRIKFVDGVIVEINDGLYSSPTTSLVTTVRAKLAIYQINHNLNFRSVKMLFNRVIERIATTADLLPNDGEFWLECQTGMQRLDANAAVVNVPLSGTYVLVISKH